MADLKTVFMKFGGIAFFLMSIRGVSLVSKFALTLFIARFMGFEVLGLYGLIASATFIVPAFAGLGIMYIACRDVVTQSSGKIVEMLNYYGRFIALIYTVLVAVAVAVGHLTGELWLAVAIIMVVLFEHINNDFYNLLLNLSKPLAANILHFIRTFIWIFLFMLAAFMYPSLQTIEVLLMFWVLGGVFALAGFFWVTKEWPWKKNTSSIPLLGWIKGKFKFSRVIYLNGMVDSSGQYATHFLVTFFLGLELTGVYVYFMQIISALSNLLRTGIIQVSRPKMVRAYKERSPLFAKLYKTCLKHTLLVAIVMAVIAVPSMYLLTLHVVDRPLALEWFPVFCISLLFFIILMATEVNILVLYSHHRDDLILKLSLFNLSGLIILNIILIPLFVLWGAAATIILMVSLILIVQSRLVKSLVRGSSR